ncbi:bifunctional pyr operon transcriptional regulator/uracil phosphoribosyltransferase PyrR [Marinobacter adhaerens]|uniref:Bifunctional pyr operon transcriptional regulator/uracil phosphoribosyltransferase PyrR n=1 Tax=Marinobacter adhaerens TaxID=1033846 RepID=A0A851HMH1_9GAMM|nr:bifunctional pyr operon transcriptional regulator/uracil phosphoribosyltransferase PyrR [Marinobacter adhaerens]NWN90213.1 bifunctional pyr operon transcriptional regulator/uracil phosphoribosyltransferase PyrR [Marinobacter adhaerens]
MSVLLEVDQLMDKLEAGLQHLLAERNIEAPLVIGIRTGGVWVADILGRRLGIEEPFGELDISFYRDDFSRIGLNPKVTPSNLPFDTEGRDIILVDDVIMSGRTIRAAMNELFDYGRPASIILAALVDLDARELPIRPDVAGQSLTLKAGQRLKLRGPDPLRLEYQETEQ